METTNQNLRQRLKVETAEAHQRLDEVMSSRGPFDSNDNYAWYLTGMGALHLHCQPSILWVESQIGLTPRKPSLCDLIASDLATLGSRFVPSKPANLADSTNSQNERSIASRWAQTYVMEGSAVGASFMIRTAKEKLPEGIGVAFLTELANDAKTRWPKVTEALAKSDVAAEAAVAAANDVFKIAHEIFSRP